MNYTPEQYKLAHRIAETLNDLDSLSQHLKFVEKFSEPFLLKMLMKAMAVPDEQIRKSRGALFTALVKQHAHRTSSWN